ncbi:PREDICTED: ferric reduction oxidase 2-like [Erythranthe guttata]|uniref:ferric reduction oxidase 2-like n=1 Tax=Erythranthe guttata TaxID=4155 RepID=UPI00064DFE12|nr:PREDICTED: ferric reduction oxidase 2-like [Erythranthe guttata]|eukprot:XP_012843950.1 PREDICTED: ferric reduction oxidase 2-like [Erythranthe guttata]
MDPQRSSVVPPFGGGNNTIRAAIMVVVMIVFSGYLFLWVMIPTNPYRLNWLPEIRKQTTSTYFGTIQGATYLMFAFPVLLIAVLGCVYVHLGKKSIDNHTKGYYLFILLFFLEINGNNNNHRLAIWKRPMIIKGLGIVTRIEIAFFIMFIALLIWSFATYMRINFATITPNTAANKGQLV